MSVNFSNCGCEEQARESQAPAHTILKQVFWSRPRHNHRDISTISTILLPGFKYNGDFGMNTDHSKTGIISQDMNKTETLTSRYFSCYTYFMPHHWPLHKRGISLFFLYISYYNVDVEKDQNYRMEEILLNPRCMIMPFLWLGRSSISSSWMSLAKTFFTPALFWSQSNNLISDRGLGFLQTQSWRRAAPD